MKASPEFVAHIAAALRSLADLSGLEAVKAAHPWVLFAAVSQAATTNPPRVNGTTFTHPAPDGWEDERRRLRDAHIETAVRAALRAI